MQKLLLLYIIINLKSSSLYSNQTENININNNENNKKTIIEECKKIILNFEQLSGHLRDKATKLIKIEKTEKEGFFYHNLIEEAKNVHIQIQSENIQQSEYNATILTHLKALENCFYYPGDRQGESIRFIGDTASSTIRGGKTDIKILTELIQLKSQLKFQRFYQNAKNDIHHFVQNIASEIDDKENQIANTIEEAYSKKFNEIKSYIGIEESDGTSIKNYIDNTTKTINTFIDQKEKNIEKTIKKSILSLSRISFCIILAIFSHSAYQRLINIHKNKKHNKNYYKSFFDFYNKNIITIIDICLLITSSLYYINTPSYLHIIWQEKNI
jgi:hypothetical protein